MNTTARVALSLASIVLPLAGAQGAAEGSALGRSAPGSDATLVLRASRIVTVEGPTFDGGAILIEGSKIRAVGPTVELPPGAVVIEVDGTVVPGFIDAHGQLASAGETTETTEAITPHVDALDGFDPFHPSVEGTLTSGVTTVAISPNEENVIGGLVAILKPAEARSVAGGVLSGRAVKISLRSAALRSDREPTSRLGLRAMLRRELGAGPVADHASGPPANGHTEGVRETVLAELTKGQRRALIDADTTAEIVSCLELLGEQGLRASLVHGSRAYHFAAALAERGVPVILGPLQATDPAWKLENPGQLEKAGVRVAFCSDAPTSEPGYVRVSAALAMSHGLSAEAALRGLTLTAAEALGIQDRVGSIAAGKDADLVVYSGDPLDLTSSVTLVIVNGKIVHRAETSQETIEATR